MPADFQIGTLDGIPRGEGRNFDVAGSVVAVFRTHADEVFATQAECPHLQGPLADGMMCPLHDRTYDLRTGKAIVGECDLVTYPIRKAADGTLVLSV
jgi:nitrite reductase (NADH) small subunit